MAEISTGSGAPEDLPPAGGVPAQPYGVPAPGPYGGYGAPSAHVPPAGSDQIASGGPDPEPGRRGALAKGAGLLVAGLLVGVLGVTALQHDGSAATRNTASTSPAGPGSQGSSGGQGFGGQGFGQGLPGGGGGVDGETRTVGTVTAVSGSSVTVRASDGTSATYQVDSDTQVARDGVEIALSDVKAGERVLVHVLPGNVAERVLVGTFRRGVGPGSAPGGATTTGDTV
jgi:hypothetical protein